MKKKCWGSEKADRYLKKKRKYADNANEKAQLGFFKLMRSLGHQMNRATFALKIKKRTKAPAVLDLCIAPGGFAAAALRINPQASVCGFSLPEESGGHKLHLLSQDKSLTSRVNVEFRDITMMAAEMGCDPDDIPAEHPEAAEFSFDRPFADQKFSLAICDGQVLRTHDRCAYRGRHEPARLTASQFVMALRRVRTNGTIVALTHQVDSLQTFCKLHSFASFSELKLFKPVEEFGKQPSFYIVATNVKPCSEGAKQAIEECMRAWKSATFDFDKENNKEIYGAVSLEQFDKMLDEFGPAYLELARPILAIEAAALRRAPWMRRQQQLQ